MDVELMYREGALMMEEIGFWASFWPAWKKIPFCGTGTKNQGKGRVDFGRWVIINETLGIRWGKAIQ